MSKIESFRVGKTDLILSYITQFFQYASSIIILPFILSYLSSNDLGTWYIFLSVSGIALLIDFGFSAALSRNVSFVFSGAKELVKDGNPDISEDKSVNYELLKSLLYTSKNTYLKIALIIFIILSTVGSFYILHATKGIGSDGILLTWLFFAFSTAFNYYYGYVLIYIKGRGYISLYNKVILLSKVSYLVIVLLLILCGFGLWSLVVGNFVSALLSRFYGLYKFYDNDLICILAEIDNSKVVNLFSIIWYNAKKFGISSFSNYAFSQAVILISGLFLSLGDVAKLGLIAQLASAIGNVARVNFLTYYPKICSLWVTNDTNSITRIFIRSQLVSYIIWFLGFGFIIFAGNYCLQLIHSNTQLPDNMVIGLYCLFTFMELTHGNCSMLISSRNTVPMLKASVAACIIAIVLMFVFVNLNMGIYSFPIAMVCANLPYNSWKWPVYAYNMLRN